MNAPSRRAQVGKYAIEFVVIVVGVFIAVAAESWWSERQDRAFERELKRDMIEEFQGNIRTIESDIAENAVVAEQFLQTATPACRENPATLPGPSVAQALLIESRQGLEGEYLASLVWADCFLAGAITNWSRFWSPVSAR